MPILQGFDTTTGERVFIPGQDNSGFYEDIKSRKSWREFNEKYDFRQQTANADYPTNGAIVEAVALDLSQGDYITTSELCESLNALVKNGGFTKKYGSLISRPRPVQAPPAPPTNPSPVGKNGLPLSASQIKWGEFARWSETASSAEVKARVRTDPAFASFVRTNLRREFQNCGDDLTPYNPHLGPQAAPTQAALADKRLVEFACAYRSMSADQVRSARRLAVNPLTAQKFIDDENQAIKLGLI